MRVTRLSLLPLILLLAAGSPAAHGQLSEEELDAISAAIPQSATAKPGRPRLVLVFNRSEGYQHSAIPRAAAALELMGRATGAFETVQSEDLSALTADNLRRFDAVCFNNTTQLKVEDPAIRAGLLEFISSGKGIIGIHAATDNFPTWPEGQELFGGYFDGHPWTGDGTWAVKITDPDHPLTAAFEKKDFLINDELYRIHPIDLRKNCRVLLAIDMKSERNRRAPGVRPADRDLPISWVRTYGRGRLFYSSLGHNDHIYASRAVLQHYLDGIQFALGDLEAPSEPIPFDPMSVYDGEIVDTLLAHIATYRYGESREALGELDAYVRSVDDTPEPRRTIEKKFLEFLNGDATTAGKEFICARLARVGGPASVPVLSGLLVDTSLGEYPLLALGSIDGSAADSALLQALDRMRGQRKIGIIGVLGDRRVDAGVYDLELLASDSDSLISAAAISSLGRIGSLSSLESLERLSASMQGRTEIVDALLTAADRLRVSGQRDRALAVYRTLRRGPTPEPARSAALRGEVLADPSRAVELLSDALMDNDPAYRSAAAGLVGQLSDTAAIRRIARSFPRYQPATQIQLLGPLARSGDADARRTVVSALGSENPEVRLAALRVVGTLGDAIVLRPLVERAAAATGAERKEARDQLAAISVPGADDSLLALLPRSGRKQRVEIIRALGERKVEPAVPALLEAAGDRSATVRTESIRALRNLVGPEHVPVLVGMIVRSKDEDERKELVSAVVTATGKSADRHVQDSILVSAYLRTKDRGVRMSLLSACGTLGVRTSLPLLREALGDRNRELRLAAIRALSAWPTPEPFPDLWAVAGGKGTNTEKILALRGSVRLLGLDSARTPAEKVSLFGEAMTIAPNDTERKMLLSAAGESRSVAGLEMAAGFFPDSLLRPEAEAAVLTIVESFPDTARREAVGQLRQIRSSSPVETNREKAGGLVRQIELYDDHITAWVYAGPYRRKWARLMDQPFEPETSANSSILWKPFRSMTDSSMRWLLEIDRNVEGQDNLVYLMTNIWSPAEQGGRLELGSDGDMKVWLNDSLVHTANVVRSIRPCADTTSVRLRSGWNPLMMKLEQGDGRWRASARIRTPEGEKLEGIRVSAIRE